MKRVVGGCSCGALTVKAVGAPRRVGVCHCLDCRKHHGAVFYAAAVFAQDCVTIAGEAAQSRGRFYCPTCGSSVYARTDDEIELHLGALEKPDQFRPTYELWTRHRESWLSPIAGAAQFTKGREEGEDV